MDLFGALSVAHGLIVAVSGDALALALPLPFAVAASVPVDEEGSCCSSDFLYHAASDVFGFSPIWETLAVVARLMATYFSLRAG